MQMYHFSYFKEQDQSVLVEFMETHPFVFLTGSYLNGQQVATQVPVLTDFQNGQLLIQGHIMRKTDHHQAWMENPNVLAVYTGPNCYVSGTWYHQIQSASTWNYMSVHVKGTIRWMDDEELMAFMRRFTLKFEGENSASSTIYDNLPAAYLEKLMPAIVGFELIADSVNNVFKLSQNRDEASYLQIIKELELLGGDSALIANEMKQRKNALFPEGAHKYSSGFNS